MNEPEIYLNGDRVSLEEFEKLSREMNEEMAALETAVADEFEVSPATASAIVYLRTRSRWTHEKEMELVDRDKAGNPIPLIDVLSGEF